MTTAVHPSPQLPDARRYPRRAVAVVVGFSAIPLVTWGFRSGRAAMAKEARG
ncbi:hypothetical protein ACFWPQ_41725 [Streptomyces sp. NPDC058464]|uniref:hypothetical protein n=1 Tax=Streptomyces sp. NPDC058464 TaxID=3346511 RepID=UPI00365C82F3